MRNYKDQNNKLSVGLKILISLIAVIIFSTFCIALDNWMASDDEPAIRRWASESGQTIVSIERTYSPFNTGPYWARGKLHRIYKVSVEDGRHIWFRMAPFGRSEKEWYGD